MPLSLAFWVLLLLWVVGVSYWGYRSPPEGRFFLGGWLLLEFLILLVIGLRIFGAPLRGG